VVRKYLHIGVEEWDSLGWDVQQVYIDGLAADEEVPFRVEEGTEQLLAAGQGPNIRSNVDAGTDVIDLAKMKAELEEARDRQRQQAQTA
jgi:hypothetical protein